MKFFVLQLAVTIHIRLVAVFEVMSYQPAQTYKRSNTPETGTATAIGFI